MNQAHTQNIESFCKKAKLRIKKQKSVFGNIFEEYLNEFIFKNNIYRGDFSDVLNLLKL